MPRTSETSLIGSRQAADIIGCDRDTLNRWVREGRIDEHHKLPGVTGSRLFDREVVEAFARERNQPAPT